MSVYIYSTRTTEWFRHDWLFYNTGTAIRILLYRIIPQGTQVSLSENKTQIKSKFINTIIYWLYIMSFTGRDILEGEY